MRFVLLVSTIQKTKSSRALKCVFLGYFKTQKGYSISKVFLLLLMLHFFKSTPHFSTQGECLNENLISTPMSIPIYPPTESSFEP